MSRCREPSGTGPARLAGPTSFFPNVLKCRELLENLLMVLITSSPTAHPRAGAVAIWLLLCVGVILGIVAIALDGGRMMEERRRGQAAADAAALAAAADLYENYPQNKGSDPNGTASAAAQSAA